MVQGSGFGVQKSHHFSSLKRGWGGGWGRGQGFRFWGLDLPPLFVVEEGTDRAVECHKVNLSTSGVNLSKSTCPLTVLRFQSQPVHFHCVLNVICQPVNLSSKTRHVYDSEDHNLILAFR